MHVHDLLTNNVTRVAQVGSDPRGAPCVINSGLAWYPSPTNNLLETERHYGIFNNILYH